MHPYHALQCNVLNHFSTSALIQCHVSQYYVKTMMFEIITSPRLMFGMHKVIIKL